MGQAHSTRTTLTVPQKRQIIKDLNALSDEERVTTEADYAEKKSKEMNTHMTAANIKHLLELAGVEFIKPPKPPKPAKPPKLKIVASLPAVQKSSPERKNNVLSDERMLQLDDLMRAVKAKNPLALRIKKKDFATWATDQLQFKVTARNVETSEVRSGVHLKKPTVGSGRPLLMTGAFDLESQTHVPVGKRVNLVPPKDHLIKDHTKPELTASQKILQEGLAEVVKAIDRGFDKIVDAWSPKPVENKVS